MTERGSDTNVTAVVPKSVMSGMVAQNATDELGGLGRLNGYLDWLGHDGLNGWVIDTKWPNDPVVLLVYIDGAIAGRVLANELRQDLLEAKIGSGHHAFTLRYPTLSALVGHTVLICREADQAEFFGGPRSLPPAALFTADVEHEIAGLLAHAAAGETEARVLTFLAQQTELLLARQAARHANRAASQAQLLLRRRFSPLLGPGRVSLPAVDVPPRRALVIDDFVPDGGRDAGSVAILSHMRALSQIGYEVSFVASQDMAEQANSAALEQAETLLIFRTPFYYSVEDVLKRQACCFDLIYLHRCSNAERYLALSRYHQPRARIIYAVADLHHLRLARQAEVQQRPELLNLSRQVALAELTAARLADAVITHSPYEAALLGAKLPPAKIHVLPWAVASQPCTTLFADRFDIAFIGNFGHPPNPDAVFWLTRQIMPLVWAQNPGIRCLIVGYGWTPAAMPQTDDRIEILGAVADLHSFLSRVRLTVAPLRFGAGVKGKVLESFAAGIPCVMSPIAAEGLALPAPLLDLVAEGAQAIARAIIMFHADEGANQAAAAAGRTMIATGYSAPQLLNAFSALLAPDERQTQI